MRSSLYIFCTHTMEIGGIETLLVRMANSIAMLGLEVLIVGPVGPMNSSLDSKVQFLECDPYDCKFLVSAVPNHVSHVNIWCSMPALGIAISNSQRDLWKNRGVSSSIVSGIFHPNQWPRPSATKLEFWIGKAIQFLASSGSIYFMNDACRDAAIREWGHSVAHFGVERLHLAAEPRKCWSPAMRNELRIVSIGRLVPFKSYSIFGVKAVKRLRDAGVNVRWDFYGDGELRDEMEALAAELHVQDWVKCHGSLDYRMFDQVVLASDLFVGMGTAALEAAQLGVPTVLAIIDSEAQSLGFLCDAADDSVGELTESAEIVSTYEIIEMYADLPLNERIELGLKCKESVSDRSGGESAPFEGLFRRGEYFPSPFIYRWKTDMLGQMFSLRRYLKRRTMF